ncbi:terminase large subunit domain-containing protein [Chromobacterium sphagni]|uniref:terminase large subunit domain-containing protein n=1 Tax=Chromobacterium sphagni TaxID=1903179 RepID=UPI001F4DE2B2|nr:terminase family protein [Chromobacterium sphagni]
MERLARVGKYQQTGRETDLNPNIAARNAGPKKPPEKNAISEEMQAQLVAAFMDRMYGYQKNWYRAGQTERIRDILKSRQIGATYYFAHEALITALETGRNQIFLSASKAQAFQFRSYIVDFVKEVAGVELKGEVIKLGNGAELSFLGTNSRTAQGRHGDLYVDEYFWIPRFLELRKLASAMASQKQYRQTTSPPLRPCRRGIPGLDRRGVQQGPAQGRTHPARCLASGSGRRRRGPDGRWRQIVTILDALAGGCDLFDVDQLRLEYSPEEFLAAVHVPVHRRRRQRVLVRGAATLHGGCLGRVGRLQAVRRAAIRQPSGLAGL